MGCQHPTNGILLTRAGYGIVYGDKYTGSFKNLLLEFDFEIAGISGFAINFPLN